MRARFRSLSSLQLPTLIRHTPWLLAALALACGASDPSNADTSSGGAGTSGPGGGATVAGSGAVSAGGSGAAAGTGTSANAGAGGSLQSGSGGVAGVSAGGAATGGAPGAAGMTASGGGGVGGTTQSGGGAAGATGGAVNGGAANGSAGKGGAASGGAAAGGAASGGAAAGGAASGGAAAGGASGAGGAAGGSTVPDCNSVTGQTVINVAADGSGQYTTVQAAINSVSSSNTTNIQLRIKPGTYKEKLSVNRPHITLCGQAGKASSTILTYSDNANTSNGSGGTLGTSGGTSTNLSASDVSAENITFENSTALGGSQAVAILVTGSRVQFRNCRFISYQDTLYVKSGSQYFKDCYISGSVDFIFGAATAVFDGCTVYSAAGGVSATAPNTDQATAYGLVFLGGQLTAASSVSAGSVALGRNWGAYGSTTYIGTVLGSHISAVGWQAMGTNTLDTARFSEYKTTGAGATAAELAKRASQSKQLTSTQAALYTVAHILGTWLPSFSQ